MSATTSMPQTPSDEILTSREAAELLRVSRRVIFEMVASGTIPSRKVGREHRFVRSRLLQWLAGADVRAASRR
jgi:excisionase family DNA binding protein